MRFKSFFTLSKNLFNGVEFCFLHDAKPEIPPTSLMKFFDDVKNDLNLNTVLIKKFMK